jgi:acetyl esterase/lipase
MRTLTQFVIAAVLLAFLAPNRAANSDSPYSLAAKLRMAYRTFPDITYLTVNDDDLKLDVYQARNASGPMPTVIYIHGGGWVSETKEANFLSLVPYFDMGWNVINVEYRLAAVALAPAAVEDCQCALRWALHNARQYNIDSDRIVVTGNSAGAHLALTTGMIPPSAGFDRRCPGPEPLKVAAIVNWYGITDVADLLAGSNRKTYAMTWIGGAGNRSAKHRMDLARRVSPLTYVRAGLPPVLSIHGDADPTVPYSQAVRLDEALTKVGVPNELITVRGGRHGNFKPEEYRKLNAEIREFLAHHGFPARGA